MKVLFNNSNYLILNWQAQDLLNQGLHAYNFSLSAALKEANQKNIKNNKINKSETVPPTSQTSSAQSLELYEIFDKYLGKKIYLNGKQVHELHVLAVQVQQLSNEEQQEELQNWLDSIDTSEGYYFDVH